ncbi:MAG: homoserine dehydrogenase [Caulobacteraceae bacterium]|nr:homoserine dehydrogenase [Caulobacteraceae bacterium]
MSDRTLWRVGVAGLGTVGAGLLALLAERPGLAPAGGQAVVTGVSARSRSRPRPVDISKLHWCDDPIELAASRDNDLFVELVGGSDGPAKAAVEMALRCGKPVVTANKALIAEHGAALAALAEEHGAPLLFEAAVMGGTPAVKMLREAMVGDEVASVAGILNGTCNYILTEMETSGRSFAEVLAEAQRLGYAEADPTTDIGGFDAAHKITILAALAFGCAPTYAAAQIEGIERVELLDIRLARDLGYRIKLVASAARSSAGVSVRVHPALTPLDHPLAAAAGALNALFIEGRRIGRIFIQGPGAGAGPTAAAVAADIADVMAGARRPVFQAPARLLRPFTAVDPRSAVGRAYVRLLVRDEPGVIAAVSETLAEAGVSIDSFLQKPVEGAGGVPIVLTTHEAPEQVILAAIARMAGLPALIEPPRMIRIARI